jgi:hypothetical protein
MGRFVKGQSGNPRGRPKKRRPNVSAFDIIFEKRLTVTQGGVERELTVDEALQFQTYHAALKGSKMAIRTVLKMIEKREVALRKLAPEPERKSSPYRLSYDSDSANEAMHLLGIICRNPQWPDGKGPRPEVVETWAAQAAISRPGRRKLDQRKREELKLFIKDFDKLRWPRSVG